MAAQHRMSTFALVSVSARLAGVPALGALALGGVGAWAADWPDIDAESSAVIRFWWLAPLVPWLAHRASALVFDLCATPADRAAVAGSWGPRFRIHRGLWHSVWAALGVGVAWWWLLQVGTAHWPGDWWRPGTAVLDVLGTMFGDPREIPVLIGETTALGMIGHVLGDGCTDFAVAPLAPVWRWHGHRYVRMGLLEPLRFKVGQPVEKHLVRPLCALLAGAAAGWVLWGAQALLVAAAALSALIWLHLDKRQRRRLLQKLGLVRKRRRRARR